MEYHHNYCLITEGTFVKTVLQEIGMLLGFHKVNTTVYQPQTDGSVERFNRTLIDMLQSLISRIGIKNLPFVIFAYRSTVQKSTGKSPFQLLYG